MIELQKQFSILGFGNHLIAGENPWLNHMAHIASAWAAWRLSGSYTFGVAEEDA
ncbi:MAG: hypothetical protein V3V08_18435 [Nannocystaceae bacterium]